MNLVESRLAQTAAMILLFLVMSQSSIATNPPDQLTIYRDPGPANTITLRWNQPGPGSFTYRIYRHVTLANLSTSNPPLNSFTSAGASLTFADFILPATSCFYLVTANDGSGESLIGLDTVGYSQVTAGSGPLPGTYSTFGLSFMTWDVSGGGPVYGLPSNKPSDIFGDQLSCGTAPVADRIIDMNNGQLGFRNSPSACAWSGTLEVGAGMTLGHGFWFNNKSATSKTIIVCGQVLRGTPYYTAALPTGTVTAPSQTPYAWREPLERPIDQIGLLTDGFTGGFALTDIALSDMIYSLGPIDAGNIAYYTSAGGWSGGSLQRIIPGQAYRILNKHNLWSYNYTFTPAP